MLENASMILEMTAAVISAGLMGVCGVRLLVRFVRVLRGEESACGYRLQRGYAPWQALAAAAGAALVSRLMVYLLAYAMYRLTGTGSAGFGESFAPLWAHWDTRHYIGIAEQGYTSAGDERLRLVFFPLYPLLMRLLSPFAGGAFGAGILISLICSAGAAALIYDLSYMYGGKAQALRAAAYFLLSPLSVFLGCAYTEALFICLTLLAVCLLRRGRPYAAAICGMLSAFTRMPGVIVAGLFIIDGLSKIPRGEFDRRAAGRMLLQVLIVFCGLFAYWLINAAVTGNPMMYLTYQKENWYQQPGSFWGSTMNTVRYFLSGVGESDWLWTWGFQLLCMLVIYLMMAFCTPSLPFDLAAYSFVYVAVVLSPTWLLSGARYLYALCTFPMMLAGLKLGRQGHALLAAAHAVMLIIWVYGYTIAIQVL